MKPKRDIAPLCEAIWKLTLTIAIFGFFALSDSALAQILRTVILDSRRDVGKYSSIAVDSHGYSHISYYDATHRVLKYALIAGLEIQISVVDNAADVGRYSSIAVDRAGNPHISYYDATNKDLKYAVKGASGWTIRTVDSPGDVGLYTSITTDELNNPWISYYGSGYIKFAHREAGAWDIKLCCQAELNEGLSGIGRSTAIQLMSTNPVILFFDFAMGRLRLGIYDRTLNTWKTEDIRDGHIIQDISLTLDTRGQPNVAFSDVTTGNETVWYGMKNCFGSGCLSQVTDTQPTGQGTWNFEQVDAATGNSVSLSLDASNLPWISYCDLSKALMLAQKGASGWSLRAVDPGWEVGLYSSIARDQNDNVHISYYDQANGFLKYASALVPPTIDVWIKDCRQDNGSTPSTPNCSQVLFSPDIWVDNNGDGVPDDLTPGTPNKLIARVRNRGSSTAQNVLVSFYVGSFVDREADIEVPRLPPTVRTSSTVTLIGERLVTALANRVVTASVQWTPPSGTRKWCIGVILDHPADRPMRPFVLPSRDNNFAVHCFR